MENIPYFLVVMQVLMTFVCIVFFISGLDDLFIDLYFWIRRFYRKFFVMTKYQPLTEQQILDKPEQFIAIMLPAWDESAVIGQMLRNTIKSINYTNYHIFVGVYPNDPKTRAEVEKAMVESDHVHLCITGDDGPTNKADCLNWICNGIRTFEQKNSMEFACFIMQDCEDVIHPLCYKLFNYLFPKADMVQLPVLSLNRKWYEFTGAHYQDEFAQLHYKDLPVRESITKSIPAAGVGVAFSRKAISVVANNNNNQIFSTNSLTEDYDFGFKLREYKLKQMFVRLFVDRTVTKKSLITGKKKQVKVKELVCIKEFFPNIFWASVRQKSRWVLGIGLQGWANLGWKGPLSIKYILYRDRKALITNLINLLGYIVVIVVVAIWIIISLDPNAYQYPSLVEEGTILWYLIVINSFCLGLRIFHRAYCVKQLHGWTEAFLSFPRMVWGNVINFFATTRALSQYLTYLRTKKTIGWDKTDHVYPEDNALNVFKPKLGEFLIGAGILTKAQLNNALSKQIEQPHLLGDILCELGYIQKAHLEGIIENM
ncbi:glycosyl transferase family protein [Nitrosomonas mobilis]|uniref:Bacteriophage N4 adsorption protein B n=1 Tax=Nitrosomonas mobilis TaxID=51642 RepID=A0A1G5SHR6_9PROT|nr:glycosyl transferase family protein [Nitrosomonas mobilis]SCZ86724.1 Bacteriophage N4 adsorption protein B [Nitrosomonas mobilis]